jgi:hypothetical protein
LLVVLAARPCPAGAQTCPNPPPGKWKINGNCGTKPRHFLGTIDDQPLIFKTNSTERMTLANTGEVSISSSLVVGPTTAGIAVYAQTSSGGEAVYGQCLTENNNCYAILGVSPAGDYAGYFSGGRGVYASSSDADRPAVRASASGSAAYALDATSSNYRAGHFLSSNSGLYSLVVEAAGGATQGTSALEVIGSARIEGNLYVAGSKAGFVVDIMQNVDEAPLTPGDVVVIVGSGPPLDGDIPVVKVRKATKRYDSAVAGVVDQVWYAPDPATKAAYKAEQAAESAARDANVAALAEAAESTDKKTVVDTAGPAPQIGEEVGTVHALAGVTSAESGDHVSVVTLGSYKAVKADASFGAIKVGDLLTTSTNPGYAMKAGRKGASVGAVIGKALASLDSGTGTIPILVTLR